MSTYDLGLILLLIATFVLAALAASAETALTSVSRIRIRRMAEEGNRRAALIQTLHADPNNYLTAILTFNTTAIIVSATAAGLIAANHGESAFLPQLIVSLLDAVLVLLLAEITAKSLALHYNLRVALAVAPAVGAITRLMRPLVRTMSVLANALTPGDVRGPFLTEDELKLVVTVGEEEGVIEEEEREMIHGVIEIGDMMVREVMVPRIDINGIEVRQSIDELIALILKHGHTRIPVYEETIDHVVGVAYAKDLLKLMGGTRRTAGELRAIARPAVFVPENKNLSEFLHEIRQSRVHMAIVVDEFGQTAGLVTIEDVLEEIIGPIRDEYDASEQEEVEWLAPNEVVLDGRVSIDDAEELLGVKLEAEDVDSLAGFIYSQVGTIPKRGQVIEIEGGIKATVVSRRGQRIGRVRMKGELPFPGAEDEFKPATRNGGSQRRQTG